MNEVPYERLVEQVRLLECENRKVCRSLRFMLYSVTGCLMILIGVAASLQNVGRFQKAVEVVDANNNLRAVVFADNGSNRSGLEIRDANGNVKLNITTNQNCDNYIGFIDNKGNERIQVGIGSKGDAYLVIRRGNGQVAHDFVAPY